MTVGGCVLRSVPPVISRAETLQSAGDVTVTGGAPALTLTPTTLYPGYTSYTSTTPLWSGGETLTFAAPGDQAPAFSLTATAPSVVQFSQPAPVPVNHTVMFDRTKDFPLAWSGSHGGDVQFIISVDEPGMAGSPQMQVDCRFPASAGTATVPAQLLMMLPASSSGTYSVRGSATKSVTVGDWLIFLRIEALYYVPNYSSYVSITTN